MTVEQQCVGMPRGQLMFQRGAIPRFGGLDLSQPAFQP
jgi:hypothetical protein